MILGKMINQVAEKGKSNPASETSDDDTNTTSDDHAEQYNIDKINEFLSDAGTKNKPVEIDNQMEVETSEEAKKKSQSGSE